MFMFFDNATPVSRAYLSANPSITLTFRQISNASAPNRRNQRTRNT